MRDRAALDITVRTRVISNAQVQAHMGRAGSDGRVGYHEAPNALLRTMAWARVGYHGRRGDRGRPKRPDQVRVSIESRAMAHMVLYEASVQRYTSTSSPNTIAYSVFI